MTALSPKMSYWFVFQNDQMLLVGQNHEQLLLTQDLIAHFSFTFVRQYSLGTMDQTEFFCAEISASDVLPPDVKLVSLRQALEMLDAEWYNAAAKAYSIINWDRNHQFCGRCSTQTEYRATPFERICPACQLVFYPRISPSIIVLIQNGDQLLMARGHHFLPGIYGLIAGFVEAGETLEDAVHREVKEEVGIKVKNLRYFGSQSWPFPDSLMIGFMADYVSGDLKIDPVEIESAGWYRYDQLPGYPSFRLGIARKLIDAYVDEQVKKAAE